MCGSRKGSGKTFLLRKLRSSEPSLLICDKELVQMIFHDIQRHRKTIMSNIFIGIVFFDSQPHISIMDVFFIS